MDQLRAQAKATQSAIAEDWKRMAAQIRASIATGVSSQREMTAEQNKLVGILDRQISVLRQRDSLTQKELAGLKAMTLERERQADAIKRGVGIGITGGTSSALGYGASQVGTQATLGLERVVDSLVNRYFGGAAGAITRTLRDVSYYSQSGAGTGGSGGIFGGLGTMVSTIAEKVGPANIALAGLLGTLTALGGVSASITLNLAKQNEAIENTAVATGLSSRQVQVYSLGRNRSVYRTRDSRIQELPDKSSWIRRQRAARILAGAVWLEHRRQFEFARLYRRPIGQGGSRASYGLHRPESRASSL